MSSSAVLMSAVDTDGLLSWQILFVSGQVASGSRAGLSVRTEGKALIAAQVDDVEWQPDCELVQLGDNQTSLRPRRLPTLLPAASALPDLAWSLTPPSLQPAPDLHTSRPGPLHLIIYSAQLHFVQFHTKQPLIRYLITYFSNYRE